MSQQLINEIVTAVLAFLLGGGLIALLRYRHETFKADKIDQREFDAKERDKYKKMAEEQDARISQLEILSINSNNPEWRKNSKGIYEYISPSYEMNILIPLDKRKEDAIGKKDEELFSGYPQLWKLLKQLDHDAATSPRKTAVRRGVRFPYNEYTMMVIKEIAQTIDNETYFIGRAYPDELLED